MCVVQETNSKQPNIVQRMANAKKKMSSHKKPEQPPKRQAVADGIEAMDAQPDVSDPVSSDEAHANALLGQVVNELKAYGPSKAGTHAMIMYMAKGQNPAYVTSEPISLDSVQFAAMTTDHKAQMAAMIKSLMK